MLSFFDRVTPAPPDPIFGLSQAFQADARPEKINLVIGAYKTEDLRPLILNVVKKAEILILENEQNKDYLPIDGDKTFLTHTKQLVFGDKENGNFYAAQTIGATSALRIGGVFLVEQGVKAISLPTPTWSNHHRIFKHAGLQVTSYPYYNAARKGFDCAAFLAALEKMPEGSAVLLHACCHNPTGCDPTREEWDQILECSTQRRLLPFFDLAYQGFGRGIAADAYPVRALKKRGGEGLVAYSYSKNFGLYAERTGALLALSHSKETAECIGSQIRVLIRGMYSNPACHGARIVAAVLSDPSLANEWAYELEGMRARIEGMRTIFLATLEDFMSGKKMRFDHMRGQIGMFSYTGLSEQQVERLTREYALYLPKDGRINVAGLNHENIPRVAKAIAAVSE